MRRTITCTVPFSPSMSPWTLETVHTDWKREWFLFYLGKGGVIFDPILLLSPLVCCFYKYWWVLMAVLWYCHVIFFASYSQHLEPLSLTVTLVCWITAPPWSQTAALPNTLFHCLWQLYLCDLDFGCSQHPIPLSLTVIVNLCVLDFGYTNTLFHCLWQLHLCDLDFGYSQHPIPVSLTVTIVCFGIQLLPTPYSIVSDSYTCVFWIAAPPWGRTATLPVPSLWHQMAPICGCTKLWLMPDCCSQSPRIPGQMMWAVHTLYWLHVLVLSVSCILDFGLKQRLVWGCVHFSGSLLIWLCKFIVSKSSNCF